MKRIVRENSGVCVLNLNLLLQLLLTFPITSVEGERSFSMLRRLYTWLRVTSTPERIINFGRMHGHWTHPSPRLARKQTYFHSILPAKNLGYDIDVNGPGGKVIFSLTFVFLEAKLLYIFLSPYSILMLRQIILNKKTFFDVFWSK